MVIVAILILVLYYYFFVLFEKRIEKPQNVSKPVASLDNTLSNGAKIRSDQYYDYDTSSIKGPFEYSIQLSNKEVVFTVPDNDYNDQRWVLPLTTRYSWENGRIVETDSCFNIPDHSTVKAEGKMLFDYIQNNHLITDQRVGTLSREIFHSDRLFYFKCNRNRIESLHSCPPGTILNDRGVTCETIHSCTGKANDYQFPDERSKFRYFRCFDEKAQHMTCPKGEIFRYDKCTVPGNLCEIRPDGFLRDIDRKSFEVCSNGKSVLHLCPLHTYALNGNCENEACENKQNDLVPIRINTGEFEMASGYGKCEKGCLVETFDCPNSWNHWETDVNLLHLPQVFDPRLGSCTKPTLCENVRITGKDVLVPQYAYSKYLKNWGLAPIFDLITGYRCDNAGNRIRETVDPGELIINFRRTKIGPQTADRVPTNDPAQYFEVASNTLEGCPPGHFFDGSECRRKNPRAFSFRHLDIFEFDGMYLNGWLKPSPVDISNKKLSCTGDFVPMDTVQACVHKDCSRLQFLYQLRSSIKLDGRYECARDGDRIEKKEYENPHDLKLEFWDQRLTTSENPRNHCTFGTRIKTGNFVLDSTIYMTCDHQQPFVFCPSNLTETIQTIGNVHACLPKQSVYEMELAKNVNVLLYKNEISGIQIPDAATVTINNNTAQKQSARFLTATEIEQHFNVTQNFFNFECDQRAMVRFAKLPTHPENVYLENGILKSNVVGVYSTIHDRQFKYINPHQYKLKECVTNLNY